MLGSKIIHYYSFFIIRISPQEFGWHDAATDALSEKTSGIMMMQRSRAARLERIILISLVLFSCVVINILFTKPPTTTINIDAIKSAVSAAHYNRIPHFGFPLDYVPQSSKKESHDSKKGIAIHGNTRLGIKMNGFAISNGMRDASQCFHTTGRCCY